jgi:hypothetical protein
VAIGGGDADTEVAVAGGGGGAETCAAVAGAAAVEVDGGGAETEAALACTAGLDAGTSALGESVRDKTRLRPTPRAMEKRIVRTVANGVSIAPIKYVAQSILLFAVIVTGGGSIPPCFFCALIIAAALFITARALLLAMTAPMTATTALTAPITVVSIIAVSCEAFWTSCAKQSWAPAAKPIVVHKKSTGNRLGLFR